MECRKKERNIGEILRLVADWRKLQRGIKEESKHGDYIIKKYSVDDAATYIGMSKKAMDDYLL